MIKVLSISCICNNIKYKEKGRKCLPLYKIMCIFEPNKKETEEQNHAKRTKIYKI